MRTPLIYVCSILLGGALAIAPGVGAAEEAPAKSQPKGKGKGKTAGKAKVGEACKTDSDCEQGSRRLVCVESDGKSRCYAPPMHPVT